MGDPVHWKDLPLCSPTRHAIEKAINGEDIHGIEIERFKAYLVSWLKYDFGLNSHIKGHLFQEVRVCDNRIDLMNFAMILLISIGIDAIE